jgi:trehalose-phosphatase
MNLVAKEYVASQVDDDGVLVLSELAGAAAELPEALVVNPYDIEAVTEALRRALEMLPDERHTRMSALRHRVRSNDVHAWTSRLLGSAVSAAGRRAAAPSPSLTAQRRLSEWITSRPALALFLDYDGTLTPIVECPDEAVLVDEAHRVLEQAVRAPDLDTVIVSGRNVEDVRRMVGVDGLTYVGDHGYQIEGPGLSYWHKAADRFQRALDGAARDFAAICVPGAWVERKRATVALHVRAVAAGLVARVTRDAEAICRRWRLAVMTGKAVIEGRPPVAWDKGQAVLHILRARQGPDWPSKVRALYIGDDATDEFAFRSLRGIGRSILVAPSGAVAQSAADLALAGPDDVLQFVRWLASGAVRAAGA